MEEEVFKVGYSTYLQKPKIKKKKWTSKLYDFILKHKLAIMIFLIIASCVIMNVCLVYNFIKILEQNIVWI